MSLPFPTAALRWALSALAALAGPAMLPVPAAAAGPGAYARQHAQQAQASTADHSKFKALQGPFKDGDGPAVTRACLTCHPKAATQVMATKHWTWRPPSPERQGFGKATHLVNNFCISILGGNQESCARCHAGYGLKDQSFDFGKAENVDCLVCHDTTGDYEKEKAGLPNPAVPLADIAQKVGRPGNRSCGVCHFFGGGGDATKHGDLDDSILRADRTVDVHLARNGAGMVCTDCHSTKAHDVAGPDYGAPADTRERPRFAGDPASRMACSSCHGEAPHPSAVLNRHYRKVACQTCHIPAFARGELPSNLSWTWSTAGRLKDGRPYEEKNEKGYETYNSIHGEMVWDRNVRPEYAWYDGSMTFTRLTDVLPEARPVVLNPLGGDYRNPAARIWPFKRHDGDQPYDTVQNKLVAPWTAGGPGSGAYWDAFDWDSAIRLGMAKAGLPYSGRHGFVKTTMWWPITHMVAPKEQALGCTECHTRNGRLARVQGFYLPGRDRSGWVDGLGWTLLLLTTAAVLVHGGYRILTARNRRQA